MEKKQYKIFDMILLVPHSLTDFLDKTENMSPKCVVQRVSQLAKQQAQPGHFIATPIFL